MSGFQWGGSAGAQWGGQHGGTWGSRGELTGRDLSWVIGPVRADYAVSDRTTIQFGQEITYEVKFGSRLPNAMERFNKLRDRIEYASENYVTTGTYEDGLPFFKERHDNDFSLVLKISPPDSQPDERGVWGVLVDGEDTSNIPFTVKRLELTVFALARDTEYTSHEQVREVHEAADIIKES